MSDAFLYLGGIGIAAYFFWLWFEDLRENRVRLKTVAAHGESISTDVINSGLPGATPVGLLAIVVAVGGALLILGIEVAGEYRLDVVEHAVDAGIDRITEGGMGRRSHQGLRLGGPDDHAVSQCRFR